MKFPHLTIHLDWPWKKTLRTAGALSIGKVVALTLEPYTVATIFGVRIPFTSILISLRIFTPTI